MQVRTDDEVYRVDAVWLGPPRATFPWRARYAAYGVGLLVMVAVMFVQRRLGISLGFFSVAWALLVTVGVTRFVGHRIDSDRPLVEWLVLFAHELRGPRRRTTGVGGPLRAEHVRVRDVAPPPHALPVPGPSGPSTALEPVDRRPVRRAPRDPDGFGPPASTTVGAPVRRARRIPPRAPAAPAASAAPAARAASMTPGTSGTAGGFAAPRAGRSRVRTPAGPVRVTSGRLDRPGTPGEDRGSPPRRR